MDDRAALLKLIGSPDFCSKRWVWEQYDSIIGGNTLQRPGGDAAVVRIGDGPKALALTCDVTPRYVEADPFEGGKQAVAETWRNITASGGVPLAITDNLNFGNPERPEIMGQFVMAIRGIGEAPRGRSTIRSSPAMSRSTTRRTGRRSCPPLDRRRRPAGRWIEEHDDRLQGRGRDRAADRRDRGLARRLGLSRGAGGPGGGRAAAGRPRRREAQRRFRASADRGAPRHRRA